MTYPQPPISVEERGARILTFWNIVAALLVLGFLVFLAKAGSGAGQTLTELRVTPVSLDPTNLPEYAARTSLRMLAAMLLSLLFTFTYATWAAKSRRAEVLLIPLLDILQSVPILGFLSVTVVFFMSPCSGRVLGARTRGNLRYLHEPGLEYGLQLLPIAAHRAGRTRRSLALLRPKQLDALLAPRGPICNATSGLEHDDVHVRRLVLRRGIRGDQRG